ncbi:MAG: short-chain dehydrogenase [Patescibacteria group bacterium]|jgi:hypothetical protein
MENSEEQSINIQNDPYLELPKIFHLEMPLYRSYNLLIKEVKEKIYELTTFSGTIDAYCIWCKKESVFKSNSSSRWVFDQWLSQIENKLEEFNWHCAHNHSHCYRSYYFTAAGTNKFQKVGQFPSVADFQIPQVGKYRKILGEEQYKELTRGVGVAAHGVGIGSFVYLRRVFENLIEEAHELSLKEEGFNEDNYKLVSMDEKIGMLKSNLPDFLVENKVLYAILSKGIHELTEDECLQYFETIKIGIEQILDEKIIQKEKADKATKAREAIQKVHGKLNGNK